MSQLTLSPTAHKNISHWLCHAGAVASLILGMLFLVAAFSLVLSMLRPDIDQSWLAAVQDNWLVILFQVNLGLIRLDSILSCLNLPLDLSIMLLVGLMVSGLYVILHRTSSILSIIAVIQPFLGLVVVLVTLVAGRCGAMGAGLVISLVMLRSNHFSRLIAILGILANGLLFAGDMYTANEQSVQLAMLIAVGYVLMIIWLFIVSRGLFRIGKGLATQKAT